MKPSDLERQDTGRMGYRWPEESPDGRLVIDLRPDWKDESERLTYMNAVEANPRRPNEGPGSYIARIAAIAQERIVPKWPGVKSVPKVRMSRDEIRRKVAELEGQREYDEE